MVRFLKCILFSVFAFAPISHADEGIVTFMWQHYQLSQVNNAFLFQLNSGVAASSCNTTKRWAVDATKPEGKAVISAVLFASAIGRRLHVVGKGVCDVHGDAETVKYIVSLPN